MKRGLAICLVCMMMLGIVQLMAQTPLGINYQGVARSADGSPLINQAIGIRVSITSGPSGSTDYVEEHHPETNEFGLFAVVVGQGQSSGNIADVDWGAGNKWLQIEIDPQDNDNFLLVGTQQMMSVPYALYAAKSGEVLTAGFGIDISNGQVNNILPDQIVTLIGAGDANVTGTYPNFTIEATDNIDDADADPNNEIQSVTKVGSTVTLSNGGGSFTDEVNDADADPTNEMQTVSKAGSTVTLSDGGGSFTDEVDDADADPTNEFQSVSKVGSTVTLSDGGGSFTDEVNDADADPTNEIQTVSKAGSTVTLSDGGGSFTDEVNDADADPVNEIQTVSKVGSTVTLSNGGGSFTDEVDDSDANPNNEIQTLSDVLTEDPDAGGLIITNLADPVNSGDAVNLSFLVAKDATDYAFKSIISDTGSGVALTFDLSTSDFDEGPLISVNKISITETGVYLFNVKGSSTSNAPIVLNVNGITDYTIGLINVNKYSDTILLKLNNGDTIELRANSTTNGEIFVLEFFGYKI